jgi:hypothetical protein
MGLDERGMPGFSTGGEPLSQESGPSAGDPTSGDVDLGAADLDDAGLGAADLGDVDLDDAGLDAPGSVTRGLGPRPRRPGPRHPDGELLDAYADGERTPGSVDRHVRACVVCQQTVIALRNVRVELTRLATVTMPPDVARRIQDALAAAPAPAAPAPADGRRGSRTDPRAAARRPGDRRRGPAVGLGAAALRPTASRSASPRSPRPERLVLVAVCLLVVVAGGGLVVALRHVGPAGSSSASSAALSVAGSTPGRPSAAEPAAAPTVASAAGQPVRVAVSRATVQPADLAQHARDLLAGRVPAATLVTMAFARSAPTAPAWAAVASPGLLACYQRLAAAVDGSLLAVDEVSYRGRIAALVVLDLPDAGDAAAFGMTARAIPAGEDQIQLNVVDLGCDADHLATATLFAEQSTKAA